MGSLIEELRRREAAARAEADRLRSRTQELSEDLARAEEQALWLAIDREETGISRSAITTPPVAADSRNSGSRPAAAYGGPPSRRRPGAVLAQGPR
jgi:hypothetical protein